ncbi:hypothetical protein GMOD_00006562 [Pyrenophora seminiperda CCB06]|uniref:Uncharacterized protein n=1 Tax=Pyrenophora seminiperda CCB06 TaxID=1302712 RepID=A0A3M7MAA0_9PLEO|nr:hypothetical protein GMOD_00006562 [Pyrenophora seminiperda CCB06]
MLSEENLQRLQFGIILLCILTGCTPQLRIAIVVLFTWAFGHILLRHFPSSPTFFRSAYKIYFILSFCLLAAYNDPFYENTFGRVLDIWFERSSLEPCVPGSGFTDWHETYRRRNKASIEEGLGTLRVLVGWTLFLVVAFVGAVVWRAVGGEEEEEKTTRSPGARVRLESVLDADFECAVRRMRLRKTFA